MTLAEQIKITGATFTPVGLAEFLAEKILRHVNAGQEISVLDPACGDGELLCAMSKALAASNSTFSITGFDSNEGYLAVAKDRALSFGAEASHFVEGDFLEAIDLSSSQLSMDFDADTKACHGKVLADVVIANPPYVRTQILGAERAQELSKKFGLKGRVDLYHPFLIAMTESLKEGGILGVITSNRYLLTKGGESIRQYLIDHYDIIEVIDLGDTKLFDAAVLPAILIGRKKTGKKSPEKVSRFLKIYEELDGLDREYRQVESIYEVLRQDVSGHFRVGKKNFKKTRGILRYDTKNGMPWEMLSEEESEWVDTVDRNSAWLVGDAFKVRVGIKTTADNVFIGDNWDALGADRPEESLLRNLISQENIEPWGINTKVSLRVLYPHYSENGKKKTIDLHDYPQAHRYFLKHENQLRGRKYVIDAGREWFEIWVPQKPDMWARPKLIFPDISLSPRFCFDVHGKIVNGNCYWISAFSELEEEKLLLIQGVANSKLMTKYHDLVFNNKLYSGRRRYFSQYVERYPIPAFEDENSKNIIRIVRQLNHSTDRAETIELQNQLEVEVGMAFGVAPILNQD